MLTEEGLKKAVGRMTRGPCEETWEIKPALNCVFFRGGACVRMYLAVMGNDGKGPSYSAGSGFIKRCKQISAGPGGAHAHIYTLAWQEAMILIPTKSYALSYTDTLGRV
ncbi:hypothetical protein QQF64_030295 [Cirrhinus molitorella]|uniref:Uncharacterized protein n=1 Tax=Cirrhinus molitorella TaxID=172907 RepID=A0ABR3N304_9TELE